MLFLRGLEITRRLARPYSVYTGTHMTLLHSPKTIAINSYTFKYVLFLRGLEITRRLNRHYSVYTGMPMMCLHSLKAKSRQTYSVQYNGELRVNSKGVRNNTQTQTTL